MPWTVTTMKTATQRTKIPLRMTKTVASPFSLHGQLPHSFLFDLIITLIRTHTLTMDNPHYATLVYPCCYR